MTFIIKGDLESHLEFDIEQHFSTFEKVDNLTADITD